MGRMYTLDKKLLVGSPEIRIGEKVYPVDDRTKNVKKIMKLFKEIKNDNDDDEKEIKNDNDDDEDKVDEALKLAFGEKYKEIENLNMPYGAYVGLIELVIKALTGEEPDKEEGKAESFPEQKQ